jgi:predicted phosphodiesterase
VIYYGDEMNSESGDKKMRIAVFSDLHGNPYACRALLRALAVEGEFDHVIGAGDLLFGGSDPAACIDMLTEAGISAIVGNTEEYIQAPEVLPIDEMHRTKWDRLVPIAHWIGDQLGPERMEWVLDMPSNLTYSPTGDPTEDMLVVHANPLNNELQIQPSPEEQKRIFGQVIQPDDDPELVAHLEGLAVGVLVHGHLHYTTQRRWRDLWMVNVAPCSVAQVDGIEGARFTIFTWEEGEWRIERHLVKYDVSQEAAALRASDMPFKEDWAALFE